MNEILADAGHAPFVIQPYTRNKDLPSNVIMLPFIPRINRLVNPWLLTNFLLKFRKNELNRHDVIICHYPIHYKAIIEHKNVIVLSHGTDWHEPPETIIDKARQKAAMELVSNENRPIIVANDTHFLEKIGVKVKSQTSFFTEVSQNIWFIPNCINQNDFFPTNCVRKNQILVPRNVREDRGIHLAIEAYSIFAKTNVDFTMIIAGIYDLNDPYYVKCTDLISNNNLGSSVSFAGTIHHEKMQELYRESLMSIIPTIAIEGTSLSALESMACKTPTISTNAGGLRDLPTLKADYTPTSISDQMVEIKNNWNKYSEKQYEATTQVYNIANWEKAWGHIVEKSINLNT